MHAIAFDGLDAEPIDHPADVKLDAVDLGERVLGPEDDEVEAEFHRAEVGLEDIDIGAILDPGETSLGAFGL